MVEHVALQIDVTVLPALERPGLVDRREARLAYDHARRTDTRHCEGRVQVKWRQNQRPYVITGRVHHGPARGRDGEVILEPIHLGICRVVD